MPFIVDPRDAPSNIIAGVNQGAMRREAPPDGPAPSALDTLAAAARSNPVGGFVDYLRHNDFDAEDAPPGYDPLDNIHGFETYAHRFALAKTPADVAGIKERIQSEQRDRDTLRRAGWAGALADTAFGLVDATFLASLAVPELTLARAVRTGKALTAAVRGAAGAAAYETVMQGVQETRTAGQSALNIGAGALLSGVLGGLGRKLPAAEREQLVGQVRREFTPVNPELGSQSFGSAAVRPASTLEAESIARGGRWFSKLAGLVPWFRTDAQRILQSDSLIARQLLQDLAEVAPILTKNTEGIASPASVESILERYPGRVADFEDQLRRLYVQHRKDPRRILVGTPALSPQEFRAAVVGAARRGDKSVFPDVTEGARFMREHIFEPLKKEAQRIGELPKDVEVVGAESYVTRLYDRPAIRASRAEWNEILTKHFMRKGLDAGDARAVTADITRRILGQDVGLANFNVRSSIPQAGPLKERVLDVPDEMIEKFLSNDPVKIADTYVRELAPPLEFTKRFGDKDMRDALDKVRQEFDVRAERIRVEQGDAGSNALAKLEKEETEVIEALTRIRDRLYGRAGRLSADASLGERIAVKIARRWLNFVAAGKLGTTALVSVPLDTGRISVQYGFLPTITRMAQLVASPTLRRMKAAEARHMGVATEVALSRRVNVANEGSVGEGWMHTLAQTVYKYTGLSHWTDFSRTLTATLLEDRILKAAAFVHGGGSLDRLTRTRLAQLGIDNEALKRIHAEVLKHGGEVDGVRVSGSGHWDDYRLSELYDAAIIKESRQLVIQPGAANKTWWQDSHFGKVLGQLKAFSIASPLKLGITPAQLVGQGHHLEAARFIGYLMAGGYLAHALRNTAAGVEVQTDPSKAAAEAFSESGVGGVLPDLISPIARRTGLFGESSRYADRNVGSAFGGPAVGLGFDAYEWIMTRSANGVSAADLQMLRRMLPFQNVFYLRRAINALQGEFAEAMDLSGADTKTFGERVVESKPLPAAIARGGTGTGVVQ